MSDDIVERLREVADQYQQSALEILLTEAADVIDQLRAAFVTASENWSAEIKRIADIHCGTVNEVNTLTFAREDNLAQIRALRVQIAKARLRAAQLVSELEADEQQVLKLEAK